MTFSALLVVALGGALGALCRYQVSQFVGRRWPSAPMPVDALFVNLTGTVLLAIIIATSAADPSVLPNRHSFLFGAVGFCGAYTTFSTFCTGAIILIRRSKARGLIYIFTTTMGSIGLFSLVLTLLS